MRRRSWAVAGWLNAQSEGEGKEEGRKGRKGKREGRKEGGMEGRMEGWRRVRAERSDNMRGRGGSVWER